MFPDWTTLSNEQQLVLSHAALRTAADLIAGQAEILATEIEDGGLADLGGPEALRLLAAIIRLAGPDAVCAPLQNLIPLGHA
jgi:hypothetical protein